MTPDTTSASWQNFYLRMRSTLTGKELPLVADEHEFPAPSKEAEETHAALVKLLKMPEFPVLFRFFRQELEKINLDKVKAVSSTEAQLRAAKAFEECIDWMAQAVVDFVAEFDYGKLEYANFVEEKLRRESGQFPPPPPIPL